MFQGNLRKRDIRAIEGAEEPIGVAWRHLRRGKIEAAITIHQRLLTIDPGPQLRNRTGDLLVRAQRAKAAIVLFLEVAEEYRESGFLDKARAIYRKILRVEPSHRAARSGLAQLESEERAASGW